MPKSGKNLKAESLTQDQKNIMKLECQSMYGYKHKKDNFTRLSHPKSNSRNFQSYLRSKRTDNNLSTSNKNDSKRVIQKPSADEINLRLERMNAAKKIK